MKIFISSIFLVVNFTVSAQLIDFKKEFGIYSYSFGSKSSSISTFKDVLYFSVDSTLYKIDSTGNLMWKKTFGNIGDMGTISDTNIILLQAESISKLDKNGNILWERDCQEIYSDYVFNRLSVINDTVYVIGRNYLNIIFFKFDGSGNLIHNKEIELQNFYYFWQLSDLEITRDSSILLAGAHNENYGLISTGDAFLVKLSLEGDILWNQYYSSGAYAYDRAEYVSEDNAANIYFMDRFIDVELTKTDVAGNFLWKKKLDNIPNHSLVFSISDENIVTIIAPSLNKDSLFVHQLDTSGSLISKKALSLRGNEDYTYSVFDIVDHNDGFYLFGSKDYSFTSSLFIEKYDSDWESLKVENLPAALLCDYKFCSVSDTILIDILVDFELSDTNTFILQLSGKDGVFSTPSGIQEIDTSGSFRWLIPLSNILDNITLNQFYYLRVKSSDKGLVSKPLFVLMAQQPDYSLHHYYADYYSNPILESSEQYCIDDELYLNLEKSDGYYGEMNDKISWNIEGDHDFNHVQGFSNTIRKKYLSWSSPGNHVITIAINNEGCLNSIIDTVPINPLPELELLLDIDSLGPNSGKITAIGDTTGWLSYQWDWNETCVDHGTGLGPYRIHWEYARMHRIGLTVIDTNHCSAGDGVIHDLSNDYYNLAFVTYNADNLPVLYWPEIPAAADSFFIVKANDHKEIILAKGNPDDFEKPCGLETDTSRLQLNCITDTTGIDTSMYYFVYYKDIYGLKSPFEPLRPIHLDFELSENQVKLHWNNYKTGSTYYMSKGSDKNNMEPIIASWGFRNADFFVDLDLEDDTLYYQVDAFCYARSIERVVKTYSNIIKVFPGTVTDLDSDFSEPYPDVNYLGNGQYSIDLNGLNRVYNSIRISDLLGRIIYEASINAAEVLIDLSGEVSSVYLIVLYDSSGFKTIKIFHSNW